jgi:pimeloyl-ACP methyl ester carboxylesterase
LQWVEDLEQMKMLSVDRLDSFEQPVNLVGYSMGGYIVALTALKNQNRIASLTLIASPYDKLPKDKFMQHREVLELIKKYNISI